MIGACPVNENSLMFSTYGTIDNQNSNNNTNINNNNNNNNNDNNNKKNSNKHARDSISYGVGSHHLDDNGDVDDDDGTNTIRMTTVLHDFDPAQNLSSLNETLQKKVTVTLSSSSIVPPSIESPSLVLPSMKYDDHEHIVSCSIDDRLLLWILLNFYYYYYHHHHHHQMYHINCHILSLIYTQQRLYHTVMLFSAAAAVVSSVDGSSIVRTEAGSW